MRPSRNLLLRKCRFHLGSLLNSFTFFDNFFCGSHRLIQNDKVVQDLMFSGKYLIFATHESYPLTSDDLELFRVFGEKDFNIVIVCNCETSRDGFLKNFKDLETKVQVFSRKNRGMDLAAHKDVLSLFSQIPGQIILMNSSVHWNAVKLLQACQIFSSLDHSNSILGGVESWQRTKHTQSFFYYADAPKSCEVLMKVFHSMRNWRFKRSVVFRGEQTIQKKMEDLKTDLIPMISYSSVLAEFMLFPELNPNCDEISELIRAGEFMNPTQHFWRELLRLDAPFIKKNLFTSNPAHLAKVPLYSIRLFDSKLI